MSKLRIVRAVEIVRPFFLFQFAGAMEKLRDEEETALRRCNQGHGNSPIGVSDAKTVWDIAFELLEPSLKDGEFSAALKRLQGPFRHALRPTMDFRALHTELKVLREAVDGDLDDKWFAVIASERAVVFRDRENEHGDFLKAQFPSAADDLEELEYCYALERHTATVFHAMRIAEIGLRALARRMRVKLPKRTRLEWAEWNTILREMNMVAESVHATLKAGPAKDELLEFYRGALGQFYGFKDEYRNHVMHTRGSYDEFQAASVRQQVREFMLKLAKRIDERGKRVIHDEEEH